MGIFDLSNSKKKVQKTMQQYGHGDTTHNQQGCGVSDTPLNAKHTPDMITTLGRNEIFVFGSNLAGQHAGGAARIACNRFGAIWGQGEGLQGNSYAIPTMQGGVETIKPYVDSFIEFAAQNPNLTFYVTKIGCGIAGFEVSEIAPLFRGALALPNVILPQAFTTCLTIQS